ncbi:TPA: hypothetical protein I9089_002425 [Clostridium perfringens]|nr:hypothetical protein [Clostridium perfringens]
MKIESIKKSKQEGARYYYNCTIKLKEVRNDDRLIICVLNKKVDIKNDFNNKDELIRYLNNLEHGNNDLEIHIMTSCPSRIKEIEEIENHIKSLEKDDELFDYEIDI